MDLSRSLTARSSGHAASTAGHTHLTDVAQDPQRKIARAQEWSRRTGRPVPPHLRPRDKLRYVAPLGSVARLASYGLHVGGPHRATPAQARRIRHKHGRAEALLVLGSGPAAR